MAKALSVSITRDELLVICNALNAEANHFDELLGRLTKTNASTRDVWRRKASGNRDLTVRLLESAKAVQS